MKVTDLNQIIEKSLFSVAKRMILKESEEKLEVYKVMCDGEPIQICNSESEANEIVDKLKKDIPGKQFIIEKDSYESYEKMIDELDKMGQELEEKQNIDMKKKTMGSLAEAILDAKLGNKNKIIVNERVINVNEMWDKMKEEESQCDECGDKYEDIEVLEYVEDDVKKFMKPPVISAKVDDIGESNAFVLAADAAKDDGKKEFEFPKGSGKMHKVTISKDIEEDMDYLSEDKTMCSECGGDMKEGMCMECGYMKESTKTKLRLKESELVSLINNMVNEAAKGQPGIPGIPGVTVTKRAQSTSEKNSRKYAKEVADKLKKYLSFEGNDNPEFPKPIGKGDKMAYRNTSSKDKKIEDNRGETNSDLTFDHEPSKDYIKRIKKSLEGDSTMGNSSDAGNVVKDKVGKQIVDKKKRKVEDKKKKKDVSWGHRGIIPTDVDIVAESKSEVNNLLNEEIKKINKLAFYNKKTN
jgi:hypothetical protein